MKRFALLFNQLPGTRLERIPFIVENFDIIPIVINNLDFGELNKYEVIYLYLVSGANLKWYSSHCNWSDVPILLRKSGITNPKIMYQLDYSSSDITKFYYPQVLPYIDCILDLMYWQYTLPSKIPLCYVTFPLDISDKMKIWKDYDDKNHRAVGLNRHYGSPSPSMDLAQRANIPIDILGYGIPKRYGIEYTTFIAERKVALDYHTNGLTWSRFAAEASYCSTPTMGPPEYNAIKVANPELAVPYGNALPILKKLLTDKDFYIECQKKAYNNITKHLDPEICGERYKNAMRKIGIDV